jgi:filamentous hemagglutinin family protein
MLHKNDKSRFALASLMSVLTVLSPTLAYAGPVGGQVVGGDASIGGSGSSTVINQTSTRAIINWQDFSIGSGEIVRFVQPDAASATLNRVVGGVSSSLLGTLEANGRVFLINPNGVLVGAGARIDTAGFLASTLDVSDSAFLQGGDLLFSGDSTAAIQNLGAINALGGDVFLIARKIENAGSITAANGTAGFAAGSEVLLTTGGRERVFIRAASAPGELVNSGVISAATAELKAAGGNAYALAINNTGVIRATGTAERNGDIWLVGTGGDVVSSGTLSAANAGGTVGGEIRVLGDTVTLGAGSVIDVSGSKTGGTALIGGGYQGSDAGAPNARATTLAAGSVVRADGAVQGGRIIVWADDHTHFAGDLSATGTQGGFVETSGHTIDILGSVRAGVGGLWLIDPVNVTIDSTQAGIIGNTLSAGSDVMITTTGAGSDAGNIVVNSGIYLDISSSSAVHPTFSLIADGSITFNGVELLAYKSGGASDDTSLSVVLQAGNNISFEGFNLWSAGHDINVSATATNGSILFDGTSAFRTAGGSVSLVAGNGVTIQHNTDYPDKGIFTGGGDLTVSSGAGQLLIADSNLTTQGGDFKLNTAATDTGKTRITYSSLDAAGGGIAIGNQDADSIIFYGGHLTAAGDITLTGHATGITTAANNQAGITLLDGSTITSTGGAVSLTGTGTADTYGSSGILINASTITGSAGGVTLTGSGEGYDTYGVRVYLGSGVSATGGTLRIEGDATVNGADYATGVGIGSGTVSNTGGNVEIVGTATGGDPILSYIQGVQIISSGSVTASGDLSIDGASVVFAGEGNAAINLAGTLSAGGANGITLDGTGASGSVVVNAAAITADKFKVTATKDITLTGTLGLALGAGGVQRSALWVFDADGSITLQDFALNAFLPGGDNTASRMDFTMTAGTDITFANANVWSAGHDINLNSDASHGSILFDASSSLRTAGGTVSLIAGNGVNIEGASGKGIFTSGGDLVITSGAGQLRIASSELSTGSGNFYLNDGIADTGKVRLIGSYLTADTGDILIGNANSGSIIAYDSHLSAGGDITLLGKATGTNTDADNRAGITFFQDSTITSTGGGLIRLTGHGTAAANGAYGILIDDAVITGSTGGVTLTGTGEGADSSGVQINHGAQITATGGTILLDGKATATAAGQNNIIGVDVYGSHIANTGGAITITGDGTTTYTGFETGFQNHGVYLDSGSSLTASGNISLTGTGGGRGDIEPPSDQRIGNFGVNTLADITVTGNGDISITGTGGNGDQTQEAQNDGNFGVVISTGTVKTQGTGNITITGNAGPSLLAAYGHGVLVNNAATIQTGGGNLLVTANGRGYEGGGFVLRDGSVLRTTGAGDLTINATTVGGVDQGYTIAARLSNGLLETENGDLTITGTNNSTSTVSASDTWAIGVNVLPSVTLRSTGSGDISITGTGGQVEGSNNNHGVAIWGTVEATGAGDITITGTGGSGLSHGVYIGTAAQEQVFGVDVGATDAKVTTANGAVSITGTSASADADAHSLFIDEGGSVAANGVVTLNAEGANGSASIHDVSTANHNLTLTAGGDVTLTGALIAGTDATLSLEPGAGRTLTQQSGASIIAGTLDLLGAGSSHALTAGTNQIGYLAADTGSISFAGEGGFAIGLSFDPLSDGITATGPVSLAATGANATLYVNSFIRLTPEADTTLDLSATRDLIVNQGATIEILGSHKADVTLTSNSLGDVDGGSVYLLQGSTLTTNNGALTVGGGQDGGFALARPGNNELPYGIWVATSTINTGAGDMTFRGIGENGVRFNGASLVTTMGDITVEGRSNVSGEAGVLIKSYVNGGGMPETPSAFRTDAGDILLNGTGGVDVAGELLASAGGISVTAGSGELALRSGASITAGGADGITLVSGGTFNNQAGANVLSATGGRWLVWSQNPAADVLGGLGYAFKQYNATYGVTATAQATGNGVLYTHAPVLTVGLTGSVTKTYDGTTSAGGFGTDNLSITNGLVSGDEVTLSFDTAAYADKNAGSGIDIDVTGIGIVSAKDGDAVVYGYQLESSVATQAIGEISKKDLLITANDATRLTYNANPVFTASYDGLVDGETSDVVTGLNFETAATLNSEAGEYAITPFGASADNYAITFAPGTLTVVRPSLEVDGVTVPVFQIEGEPVITDTHAVVVIGGRLTLVSLVDLDTGNSRSLEHDMGNAITAPPLFTYSFPKRFTPVSYRATVTGTNPSGPLPLAAASFADFLDTEAAR